MIINGNTLITTQIIGDLSKKKKCHQPNLGLGADIYVNRAIKYELRQLKTSVLHSHFKLY